MGREIELKIPLEEEQYDSLLSLINKNGFKGISCSDTAEILKTDEYWSRYDTHEERIKNGEPRVIRIRCEEQGSEQVQAFFTLKQKTVQNGIEFNEEQETFIQNPDVLRNVFLATGFKKWFCKEKKSVSCYARSSGSEGLVFHLELEKVNGLPYLEIEYTKDDEEPQKIRSALESLVRELGLNPEKRDSRSWVEIIQENNRK